ncbi:septum formation initiator family protein [Clostridia bacterium]|nr:septum formation initiator family protein [Clostridia bacterium]
MDNREQNSVYDDPGRRAKKKKRKPKIKRTFVTVLLGLVFLYAIFMITKTQWSLFQTNQEVEALQQQLNEVQEEQEALLELKDYVGSDEYIEYKARKELGLIKQGEHLIVLDETLEDGEEK